MNLKQSLNMGLFMAGVLVLVSLGYGFSHPTRIKGRSQRLTGVNAAPRIVLSFTLSNVPDATATSPFPVK